MFNITGVTFGRFDDENFERLDLDLPQVRCELAELRNQASDNVVFLKAIPGAVKVESEEFEVTIVPLDDASRDTLKVLADAMIANDGTVMVTNKDGELLRWVDGELDDEDREVLCHLIAE